MEENEQSEKRLKLQSVQERIQEVISIIIVFETDLSTECSDGVYYRVIKVIHRMLTEVQQTVDELVQCIKESTE